MHSGADESVYAPEPTPPAQLFHYRLILASGRSNGRRSTPAVIRTGDVHVLRGEGMPKPGRPGEKGDLYVQFVVEPPGSGVGGGKGKVDNLSPAERIELARLLSKLDGTEFDPPTTAASGKEEEGVRVLSEASASDFGSSDDRSDDDPGDDPPPPSAAGDLNGFFQRAFGGRSGGPGGGFGVHSGGPGGFQFYSSSSAGGGFGHGGDRGLGEDEEHNVECSQM